MRRYLFHLGVFHLQIHDTKVSTPGCCLAGDWIFLAEVGRYRIPGYPHAYRCGRGRTMTRSRCLALRNSNSLPTSLLLTEIAGFFKKMMTIFSIVCTSQSHVIHFHAICGVAVLGADRIFSEKQSEPQTSPG